MSIPRSGHRATLLENGQVLVVGGFDGTTLVGSAELYDPTTRSWTGTSGINDMIYFTATRLNAGTVVVAGGAAGVYPINHSTPVAMLYNPSPAGWTTGNMSASRCCHTATLLPSGQVLVVGGESFAIVDR